MSSRSSKGGGRDTRLRQATTSTDSECRGSSGEANETVRHQIRKELIQELLEACGNDAEKRQVIAELAEKVLQGEAAPLHSPTKDNENHDDGDDDDESEDTNNYKWTDVESIGEIQDSPYEIGASAEVGEELFEEFKALLEPQQHSTERRRSGTGTLRPTKRAIQILGEERAEAMVTANHYISDSGMVFSSSWIDGEIRGIRIPGLTKVMLVLCLQEQRIARAEKGVMNKLVEKLNLADIIREVLDDLEGIGADQFPKLSTCTETPLPYDRSHKYECQKCELFVARTFACMNFLKRDCLENKIVKKLLACLRIMEDHLDVPTDPTRPPRQIQIPTDPEGRKFESEHDKNTTGGRKSRAVDDTVSRGTTSDPVEQLDLQTGKVLATFPSFRAANVALGRDENCTGIRKNVLDAQLSAYGYFWRPVGSKKLPEGVKPIAEKPVSTPKQQNNTPGKQKSFQNKPVEKLDLLTGAVLATFPSIAAATISLGLDPKRHGIADNLAGRLKSAYGFFWRLAGSKDLPDPTPQMFTKRKNVESNKNQKSPKKSVEPTITPRSDGRLRSSSGSLWRQTGPLTEGDNGGTKSGISTNDSQSNANNRTKRGIHEVTGTAEDTSAKLRKRRFEEPTDATEDPTSKEPVPGKSSLREISAMNQIKDSPYQVDATAEVGEDLFENFKALLVPASGSGRRQQRASEAAIKVFGESLADAILEASSKIGLSGVIYSPEWKDGSIRGAKVGSIPTPILLLLLQEQRFSRPGVTGALVQVVVDFELCRTVIKALVRWNMVDKYPKVSQTTTHAHFTTQKVQCYKCLIFIARVFHCMKILNMEVMPESIKHKVESCFQILESNFGGQRGSSAPTTSQRETPNAPWNQEGAQASNANDDGSLGSTAAPFLTRSPPKEINEHSHILFQVQSSSKAAETEPELPPNDGAPCGTTMNGAPQDAEIPPLHDQDLSSWVPYDPKEVILSPIETETAWLVEESIYSLRTREIQWRFVWKYASPTLRVELRKINDSSGNELEQLVRLQDTIVATRFANLRREIRRKLHRAQYRPRMEKAIPDERMASRQLMDNNNTNPTSVEVSGT